MEAIIVIAGYRPKPGKAQELQKLMRSHLPRLHALGLVTDRPSIMMESADETIIEVFEWKSMAAIEMAHTNPDVLKMWEEYADVCDYVPVGTVKESAQLFSSFKPFE